jgi:hypothetical protein
MSRRELERVRVLARVRSKQLPLVDAGRLMGELSADEAAVEALSGGKERRNLLVRFDLRAEFIPGTRILLLVVFESLVHI